MSAALALSAIISTVVIGAPPEPCPQGQTRAPLAVVEGVVESACVPIDDGTTQAPVSDAARYAEREKQAAPKVSEFRGGNAVIYISGGALLVALIIILILL